MVGFTVGENGDIWVSLDAEWTSAEHSSTPFSRLLSWGGDTVRYFGPFLAYSAQEAPT